MGRYCRMGNDEEQENDVERERIINDAGRENNKNRTGMNLEENDT